MAHLATVDSCESALTHVIPQTHTPLTQRAHLPATLASAGANPCPRLLLQLQPTRNVPNQCTLNSACRERAEGLYLLLIAQEKKDYSLTNWAPPSTSTSSPASEAWQSSLPVFPPVSGLSQSLCSFAMTVDGGTRLSTRSGSGSLL